VLIVELKRPQEDISSKAFHRHADCDLDDFLRESENPDGTAMFGAIGLGTYVIFYKKVLPGGKMKPIHKAPYHLKENTAEIQELFDYFKEHACEYNTANNTPAASGSSGR
jgi:hypothetical protein